MRTYGERRRDGVRPRKLLAWLGVFLVASAGGAEPAPPRKHSNVERMTLSRLAAAHADVQRLRPLRRNLSPVPGLQDYRCILHAHAEDSAHTGGTLPEMLADAKKAGVHAILLTDHFRPPRDFIDGRWRGMKDGVLFIPGSESHGFLLYPTNSILKQMDRKGKDLIDIATVGEGMVFLSHLEERLDHPIDGLTGMEIYNRHYDAKKDKAGILNLVMKLTDPRGVADLQEAVKLYPEELLAFQCDYPKLYLDKWDAGTQKKKLTGVAANDCHHNQILIVKMVDENTVLVGTNVDQDKQMQKVTSLFRSGIKEMTRGRKPGDILVRIDTDPYHRSFLNCSTHILAPRLDEASLRSALKAGHAYVAHDWMGDPTGFQFRAATAESSPLGWMGDDVKFARGMKLSAALPLPALVRLMRNGEEVERREGQNDFAHEIPQPGVYRLETWLKIDGEYRPWILSNPIYVR